MGRAVSLTAGAECGSLQFRLRWHRPLHILPRNRTKPMSITGSREVEGSTRPLDGRAVSQPGSVFLVAFPSSYTHGCFRRKQWTREGLPWDVFIHLLAVIAVCASVYGAASLFFTFVNTAFPDPLDSPLSINDDLRFEIAILFISFPVYCWAWRSIQTDLMLNPAKRTRWIRTCPIYLTIFLAGLLLLGDAIGLLYHFLGGDLTARFVLKVAVLALVSGTVLLFYRERFVRSLAEIHVCGGR